MRPMYSKIVIDHFMNPRNIGDMADADGIGVGGDPKCGDALKIFIKIRNNRIEDIRFVVSGCDASIATSSMTTVLAKGKTLEEALKIKETDVIQALGGLPEEKQHCSNLGVKALQSAIKDYYDKQKEGKKY